MNIVEYAEKELGLGLSCFQKDLLLLLQNNPEGWLHCVKPTTYEVVQVKYIYNKWQESMLVAV